MNDQATALAHAKLEAAKARLKEARDLIQTGGFPGAVSRAYYALLAATRALLAATRALLALKSLDSKSHHAAFVMFHNHYVKTGLFPKETAELAKKAKNIRELADYDETAAITPDDARREYAAAAKFVAAVEKFMKEKRTADGKPKKRTPR